MEAIAKCFKLEKRAAEKTVAVTLPVLKQGDSGLAVWALGSLLEGCDHLDSESMQFGEAAAKGLKAFQKEMGLPQTGVCDKADWEHLLGVIQ